jgi:uncharacterized membrane protein
MLIKLARFSILTFVIGLSPLSGIAQQTQPSTSQPPFVYWPGPWQMWGDGYGWQFWWIFPLMMLFMLLIFCAVFFFLRRSWAAGPHHWGPPSRMMDRAWGPPTHSALQILDERFARSEIQKDEYEQRKGTILSGGP